MLPEVLNLTDPASPAPPLLPAKPEFVASEDSPPAPPPPPTDWAKMPCAPSPVVTHRRNVAAVGHSDRPARAATAAPTAHGNDAAGRSAIAPTAANALRHDAPRRVFRRRDRSKILHGDRPAVARTAAITADGDQAARRGTAASATPHGLGKNAVRPQARGGNDPPCAVGDGHSTPTAAVRAGSAESHKTSAASTGAATAADALGEDAARIIARGQDRAIVRHRHGSAIAAIVGGALQGKDEIARGAGGSSRAADAFREDAVGEISGRADHAIAGVGNGHGPAAAAKAAAAALPHESPLAPTVAAVVAHAQSVDAEGPVSRGDDRAVIGDRHCAAIARVSTRAASRRRESAAAVPGLPAAAIGEDAKGIRSRRGHLNPGAVDHRGRAAGAAIAAVPAAPKGQV